MLKRHGGRGGADGAEGLHMLSVAHLRVSPLHTTCSPSAGIAGLVALSFGVVGLIIIVWLSFHRESRIALVGRFIIMAEAEHHG